MKADGMSQHANNGNTHDPNAWAYTLTASKKYQELSMKIKRTTSTSSTWLGGIEKPIEKKLLSGST